MKGKLLGKGRTAEIFEYGEGKALKLFNKGWESWAELEMTRASIACRCEIPTPRVHGILTRDERQGIIYDRVDGSDMGELLSRHPLRVAKLARDAAIIHSHINGHEINELQNQNEMFSHRISSAPFLSEAEKAAIITYAAQLPDPGCLCHGDLHPENYMWNGEKLIVIDWLTAYAGHPAGDAARVLLMMASPSITGEISFPMNWLTSLVLNRFRRAFRSTYLKQTGYHSSLLKDFLLPVAAVRLTENIPREKEWLLGIIRREMNRQCSKFLTSSLP